jgi:peptidylprolyl isomerase
MIRSGERGCGLLLRAVRTVIPTSQYSYKLKSNPFVTVPLLRGEQSLGALHIELFERQLPKTVDNFLRLLRRYEGNRVYRIWPGMYLESGDVTKDDGTGGESARGLRVRDESFEILHDSFGVLSMVSNLNNVNSKFVVTLGPCHFFDYRYVAFGRVSKGLQALREVEKYGSEGGAPSAEIRLGRIELHEAGPVKILLADGHGHSAERDIYQPDRNY